MNHRIIIIAGVSMLMCVGGAALAQAPDLENMDFVLKSIPDGPVASVSGRNISAEAFLTVYKNEILRLKALGRDQKIPDEVRLEVCLMSLGILIQRELLFEEAEDLGLEPTSAELSGAWKTQSELLKKGFADGGDLGEADLLERLNITEEEALEDVRRSILIGMMRDTILGKSTIAVSDKEIKVAFEESKNSFVRPDTVHLKQIFVAPKLGRDGDITKQKAKAREKTENALDLILAGQRFDKIAEAVSESPDRKRGGDMGLLNVSTLPDFMVEAAMALEPGGISDVIESEYGYHIVELIEFVPGAKPTLEKTRPFLRKRLIEAKSEDLVRDHCDALIKAGRQVRVYLRLDQTLTVDPSLRHLLSRR